MYFSYKNTEERLYFKNERIKLMLVSPPQKKIIIGIMMVTTEW